MEQMQSSGLVAVNVNKRLKLLIFCKKKRSLLKLLTQDSLRHLIKMLLQDSENLPIISLEDHMISGGLGSAQSAVKSSD